MTVITWMRCKANYPTSCQLHPARWQHIAGHTDSYTQSYIQTLTDWYHSNFCNLHNNFSFSIYYNSIVYTAAYVFNPILVSLFYSVQCTIFLYRVINSCQKPICTFFCKQCMLETKLTMWQHRILFSTDWGWVRSNVPLEKHNTSFWDHILWVW